ncbi:hypothetical protein KUV50_12495 [Membranicola marinus]|uniref:Uncharacterized protein n=1 Tax=Membranihabitans marinus TaxID=1227546 RepID=A0A953L7Q3_9BACT|nr:hypothetical protein [Membranihabitans marinus]MBY5958962.1 hypothetical protein [Membranihabitans marinus]
MEIKISGDDPKLLKQVEELAKNLGLKITKSDIDQEAIKNNKMALNALQNLAKSKAFKDIKDPVSWQREVRKDREIGWT